MRAVMISVVLFVAMSFAQVERWVYRFNGQSNGADYGNSIAFGLDRNIYACGSSKNSPGGDDFTVISLDTLGNERWVYMYGLSDTISDIAKSVTYGLDGNIYVAGFSHTMSTMDDLLVISLDAGGNERWVYRSDSLVRSWDKVSAIIYGLDNNLYIVGQDKELDINHMRDFAVLSLDTAGNERWWYRYNGIGDHWDWAESIVYGLDGNLYIAGRSRGMDDEDFTVISLDTDGNERWVYIYNRLPQNALDRAHSIDYGIDGNLYVAGMTANDTLGGWPVYSHDFTVISVDTAGSERWIYHYNGAAMWVDAAQAITCGLDGNIYAGGGTWEFGQEDNLIVVSLDQNGTDRWIYTYNGSNSMDAAGTVCYGLDNNIYAAGASVGLGSDRDCLTISLDSSGTERWTYRYNGPGNYRDRFLSMVYGEDGNVYCVGLSYDSLTGNDFIVIGLGSTTGLEEEVMVPAKNNNSNATILSGPLLLPKNKNCRVFDITGRVVTPQHIKPGIYFIEIDGKITEKVVKVR